jgi:hypothetical protein
LLTVKITFTALVPERLGYLLIFAAIFLIIKMELYLQETVEFL